MPSWNPGQYAKFAAERTQPSRDLARRVALERVDSAIDLGCGPGNSTEIVAARWPAARITGLDNSPQMIAEATRLHPDWSWQVGEIASWAEAEGPPHGLLFSNAALQWVPHHETLYPRLFARVAPGGALAVQVPGNFDAPAHRLMRELAASPSWRSRFPDEGVREWFVHDLGFYYDLLSPAADRIDLWATEYMHVLPDPEAIVEWYKGTGLRPFLEALRSDPEREAFLADYLGLVRREYRAQADGNVLFPFRRLFLVAYRAA